MRFRLRHITCLPRWTGTGLALLLLLSAPAARAQPTGTAPAARPADTTPPPAARPAPARPTPWAAGVPASERAKALAFFKAGNSFFERSQYAKALAQYRKAIPHWNHPAIRYNMAVCLVNLDRFLEAHRSLQRALQYGVAPLGAAVHAQAVTARKLLLGRLARIQLVCSEPDAQVSLDGAPPKRCGDLKTRWVLVGKHVVVAKKAGFLTATLNPILLGGRVTRVRVKLLRLEAALRMKRRWPRWIPWTALAVGAAVALSGMPLLLVARSDIDTYDSKIASLCADQGCAPGTVPSSVRDIEKHAQAKNVAGFVLIGLGGAAVAAAVALVILNQPRAVRSRRPADKPAVSILPTGNGAVATFRF